MFVNFCLIYCARYTLILSISQSIESRWDWKVKQLIVVSVIASEDSLYPARLFLLKGASRVTTITHTYITTTIIKRMPSFIPLKVFRSMLTELCWCEVTANTHLETSEFNSKCQTSLVLVKAYRLSPRFKHTHIHTYTHLGSPLKNRETTLGRTTVSLIQQVEMNEQQSGRVMPWLPSDSPIK